MNPRWFILLPMVATLTVAGWSATLGAWWPLLLGVMAVVAGVVVIVGLPNKISSGTRSAALAADPRLLELQRQNITEELAVLEDAQELQRGVFEVSAELVGCVDEVDARHRVAAAMRRYWACDAVDLVVWEKGSWRGMGAPATGEVPALTGPVMLSDQPGGDVVLDLSPGVDGQAALVLRQARLQPSLIGRSAADQRYVAEVLRTQLSLSLRRVVLYGQLQSLARLDPLTGTQRRWYGETRLSELCDVGDVVAVAMVDIDYFKTVNDEFGHAAGDQVLAAVGRVLAAHLRTGDLVSRYGGEEFLVILPDTPPAGALQVVDRLREAVAALKGVPKAVTVSIGVAACHQDETADHLVSRADAALYLAKHAGRNRIVMSDDGGADGFLRTTARHTKQVIGAESATYRALAPPKNASSSES